MMTDSPLRTHTWQASSWFYKTRMRLGRTSKLSAGETLVISRCFPSSSSWAHWRREAEPGSGGATLSTAVFYSPCLQVDRFQIVRDQGLVQKERCGNSHSDDGWGPRRDRCLAPSRLCSAALPQRCRAPRTTAAVTWTQRGGAGDAPQPIAAPGKPCTCVESGPVWREGMCPAGEPASRPRVTCRLCAVRFNWESATNHLLKEHSVVLLKKRWWEEKDVHWLISSSSA